jgi:hypothetical protein
MHAAHLREVPAVVLWGTTDYRVIGYADQIHLKADFDCEYFGSCVDRETQSQQLCPKGEARCMNALEPADIYRAVLSILDRRRRQKSR